MFFSFQVYKHFSILYVLLIYFFGSFVNDKFSNLKLNVFIITSIISSNKYLKQVVLINHIWITPTLQRRWGLEFCLLFKK